MPMRSTVSVLKSPPILWIAGPALVVAVMYGVSLGHRSDYFGHFAAGFGGTIMAMAFVMASFASLSRLLPWFIFTAGVMSILFGAMLEATVFRIGRFDEVDFFNQSLGAVLAALVALRLSALKATSADVLAQCLLAGIVFLAGGFFFAFK